MLVSAALALTALATGTPAAADPRLPTIAPSAYTEAQREAAQAFEAARKTPVFGPFEPLMYSPQLMTLARAMGDYLRYKPAIGTQLSELAILVTARRWNQDYEWSVHQPIALKVGIPPAVVEAVGRGEAPQDLNGDMALVYRFAAALTSTGEVPDAAYAPVAQRFGQQGAVDLAGICGYYTLLALELNMARYPVPAGQPVLPARSANP